MGAFLSKNRAKKTNKNSIGNGSSSLNSTNQLLANVHFDLTESKQPNVATHSADQMPASSFLPILSPFLKTREQISQLLPLNKQFHALFKEAISANHLLDLSVNYKLTEKESEKLKKDKLEAKVQESKDTVITNPILNAIDIILQKAFHSAPLLPLKNEYITDHLNHRQYISAFEYAYKARNFALYDLLVRYLKRTADGAKQAANLIRKINEKLMQYDLHLMPMIDLSKNQKVEDILPINRIILLPENAEVPVVIPDDAILFQKKAEEIKVYRMINNMAREDKSVADDNLNLNFPKKGEKPSEISEDTNSKLFNKIKLRLDYPKSLEEKPALIKQFDENANVTIYQWGELNGEWQLTKLKDQVLFEQLPFPESTAQHFALLENKKITPEMYQALKIGHAEGFFDLGEYVRAMQAFLKKYLVGQAVPRDQWPQFDADWFKIGRIQKKFRAWIGQLWCSYLPFDPIPDFSAAALKADSYLLKDYFDCDFYRAGLGVSVGMYKGAVGCCGLAAGWEGGWRVAGLVLDLAAMSRLCEVINEKFENINQLILDLEKPPVLGFSSQT